MMSPVSPVPDRIGRYRTKGVLGTGTFATVVLAADDALEADVAVKVLAENWSLDADIRSRFVREARLLRRIDSERLVRVHDIGELDHRPYFVMDHVAGGTLEERLELLRQRGGLPIDAVKALRLAEDLAACVAATHSFGLIHRDVKPTNLLIRSRSTPHHGPEAPDCVDLLGIDEELVLTDFGLARDKAAGSALSIGAGTQTYMAPEQADVSMAVDERADLYACTVILAAVLTGAPPAHLVDTDRRAGLLDQFEAPIASVLELGLAQDRDRRPGSSDEWIAAVRAALGPSSERIRAAPAAVSRPTVPRWLADLRRRPIIGRDAALEGFREMWDRTRAGARCAVLVKGEAGIGKSRLLAELASLAASEGGIVLAGRAETDVRAPYGALVHAVRPALAVDAALDATLEAVGPAAGHLALVLPELAARVEPPAAHSHPESSRALLLHAIDRLLAEVGAGTPLVLIVDDLHAADSSTLDALAHLVSSGETQPLLVVGAYRDTEVDADDPVIGLYEELRRHDAVARTSLAGLEPPELGELVAQRDVTSPTATVLGTLRTQTGGNPFFVEELLTSLAEESVTLADGIDHVPEAALDVVRARLRRLPDHVRETLAAAAVVGHRFDRSTVELLCHSDVLGGLDAALSGGFVDRSEDGYAFRHGLVRTALLHDIDRREAAELHWRAGEVLERLHAADLDDHVVEIAHHLRLGVAAGDARRAATWLERAGHRQYRTVALDDAVASLSTAVALHPDTSTDGMRWRMQVLELIAEAQFWRADPDAMRTAALEAAEIARASGTASDVARTAILAARWNQGGALDRTVLELLDDAHERLDPGDSGLRSQVLAMRAYVLQGAGQGFDARSIAQAAHEMASRCDDPEALSMAALVRTYTESGAAAVADTRRVVAQLERTAARLDREDRRRMYAVHALRARAHLQVVLGDAEGFAATRAELGELASRVRATYWQSQVLQWDAAIALASGRFDEASHLADVALMSWDRRASAERVHLIQVGMVEYERGWHERLLPEMERLVAPQTNSAGFAWKAALAAGLAELGRQGKARARLDELAVDAFNRLADDVQRPNAIRWLAEAVAALRCRDEAEALLPIVEPYTGQVLSGPMLVTVAGTADRAIGQLLATLGRYDDAEEHYLRAATLEERLGFAALEARTRAWWAQTVHDRGTSDDADRARTLATDAAERAHRLGMTLLAASARKLAASAS